jgi:hypothetical protein
MDNLGFGLGVTAVGLAIVFGLLAVLWLLLTLALRFERGASGAVDGAAGATGADGDGEDGPRAASGPAQAGTLDPRLVAAITVAVVRHADARRRQAAPAMRSYWPGSLLFASRWVGAGRMRQGQSWRRRGR